MTEQTAGPPRGGEASYATLARVLTAFYGLDPALQSRQVHQWFRRETKNKAGDPFPLPVRTVPEARRGQPHYLFSVREVLAWYEPGVPDQHGKGWKIPDPLAALGNASAP